MTSATVDPDSCYRAVTTRDARFDGMFFTAVKTTGIYCRPVCPARTPKRSSCTFYRTAASAERAGFRPCLRCRPELAPGRVDYETSLAEAILTHLQTRALESGGAEALAAEIGLSSRQVRRILLDRFGVTPIEVVQTQRLLFARKLLRETDLSMTQLAFASGFQSLRRFNAAFREHYGQTPSQLRRESVEEREDIEGAASDADIVLRLSYRPPYDWDTLCRYLGGRATSGVEEAVVEDGVATYRRTVSLRHGDDVVRGWLSVTHDARSRLRSAATAHALTITLSNTLLPVLMPTTQRLRGLLDLDADPARIAAHLRADPLLTEEVDAAPGLRMPGAWEPFELALRAVLGQQISVAGASTLSGRVAARFGDTVVTPFARLDRSAPTPETLARADVADIAAIGMPRARAGTVRELARFAADGGLTMPPGTSADDAVARLDAVPGIGPWTAQYIAMRALRYPDAFPAGDLGLRKAAGLLADTGMPTERQLDARAEQWRPWRAYAAATLWHSLARRAAPPTTKGRKA